MKCFTRPLSIHIFPKRRVLTGFIMIVILFYMTWSNLDFGKPDSSLFQHIKKIVSSRLEMLPLEEAKRILFVVIAIGNNSPNDDVTHDNVKAAMAMGGDHSGPHGV